MWIEGGECSAKSEEFEVVWAHGEESSEALGRAFRVERRKKTWRQCVEGDLAALGTEEAAVMEEDRRKYVNHLTLGDYRKI